MRRVSHQDDHIRTTNPVRAMRQPVSELRVPSAEDCHGLERGLPFPHLRPGSWKQAKSKDGLRRVASAVIYRRAKSRGLSREPLGLVR